MMNTNQTPAFPTLEVKDVVPGMTLRDYFAAAALTGLLADPEAHGTNAKNFALDAYTLANEMMRVRQL